jgi:hypothetical protein
LKASGDEWDAYILATRIRHRLTHPKDVGELTVSETEFNGALFKTWEWFNRVFEEVVRSVYEQAKHGPVTPLPD